MSLVYKTILAEGEKRDPRKAWLVVDGAPVAVVMDNWAKETHEDKDYLVDYTAHGEIRMIVPVGDIIAVRFYDR